MNPPARIEGGTGSWLRRLFLLLALATPLTPVLGQVSSPRATPFIMAADAEGPVYRFAKLIYVEAFRRLGIPVEMPVIALARRAAMIEAGAIDGEGARVYAWGETHPEVIRVEESLLDLTFSVFTANPALLGKSLAELPPTALVEYRRGILVCETALKKSIPAPRLSTITTTEQGIKKLLAGHTDAYCDLEPYVREALRSPEIKNAANTRKLFDIASLATYPYLFKKHGELAPRLAAVLKQMKTEGLLDRYRIEAERETGTSH